jgi:hypothetical protein
MRSKPKDEKEVILAGAMNIFFEAMLMEKLGSGRALAVGHYRLVKFNQVTSLSGYVQGGVTISFDSKPIWQMTYEGHYPKEVLPFLKEVLSATYLLSEFWGGRGPFRYRLGNMEYRNSAENGSFEKFHGREQIIVGENEVGHVTFSGGII